MYSSKIVYKLQVVRAVRQLYKVGIQIQIGEQQIETNCSDSPALINGDFTWLKRFLDTSAAGPWLYTTLLQYVLNLRHSI